MHEIATFPETARVWIYQADRPLPERETGSVRSAIRGFTKEWTSHNVMLQATGDLLYQRFVVLMVNDANAGVGGCSIDASVQFVRSLMKEYDVDFMDRLNFAYIAENQEVKTVHKDHLAKLFSDGVITNDTMFFDNLVQTKSDFESRWLTPLGESWMKRFL